MTQAIGQSAEAALESYLSDTTNSAKARRAAEVLMSHNQWQTAASVWQSVLGQGPAAIDDILSYGTCLAKAGAMEPARALARTLAPILRNLDAPQRAKLAGLALPLYQDAALLFAAGHQEAAEAIVDLFMAHEPFGRRLLGLEVPEDEVARPPVLQESVVADFIRQTIADSAAGRLSPPGRGRSRAEYEAAFARYRGHRVLIVHRERYWPNPTSERHPVSDYFLDSAREIGLDARLLRSDFACVVPTAMNPPSTTAALKDIIQTIETWRPETIVYDNFGGPGCDAITDAVCDLRQRYGFKLVGLYHDVWSASILANMARIQDELDAVWVFDPTETSAALQAIPRSIGTVPPIPEGPFAAARARVSPTIDLGFLGTIARSNFIRGIWMMEARRRGVSLHMVTGFPHPTTTYRTIHGFAEFLASCKVSLCICGRTTQEDAIPARVWEGIFARTVLLEDNTRHVRHLLTPFAHYIPFRTADELAFYADFLARRDDIREAITTHALDFVRETYPAVRAWSAVLETAERRAGA